MNLHRITPVFFTKEKVSVISVIICLEKISVVLLPNHNKLDEIIFTRARRLQSFDAGSILHNSRMHDEPI